MVFVVVDGVVAVGLVLLVLVGVLGVVLVVAVVVGVVEVAVVVVADEVAALPPPPQAVSNAVSIRVERPGANNLFIKKVSTNPFACKCLN